MGGGARTGSSSGAPDTSAIGAGGMEEEQVGLQKVLELRSGGFGW